MTPDSSRPDESVWYTLIGAVPAPVNSTDPAISVPVSAVILGDDQTEFPDELVDILFSAGIRFVIYTAVSMSPGLASRKISEFPGLSILLRREPGNQGLTMNSAIRESRGEHVLVLQSRMRLKNGFLLKELYSKIEKSSLLCITPRLYAHEGEEQPSVRIPLRTGHRFFPYPVLPEFSRKVAGYPTLYPLEYVGIYHKGTYTAMGGFDAGLHGRYWQLLEFGLRAWLTGNKIVVDPEFIVHTTLPIHEEIVGAGPDNARVWLRTMAPLFVQDHVRLPRTTFLGYGIRHKGSLLCIFRSWRKDREWVKSRAFTYRSDLKGLADSWEETLDTCEDSGQTVLF